MSMPFDSHASEETLERYALGTLLEAETEPFEEHLLVCPVCQDRLAEMDAFVAATRRAAERMLGESPGGRAWWGSRLLANRPWPKAAWVSVLAGAALLLLTLAGTWGLPRMGEAAAVTVLLESVRGVEGARGARAPAGRPLVLQLDLTALPRLPSYALELVDWRGQWVLEGAVPRGGGKASFQVGRLTPGQYWIRLYDPSSRKELLREFGLEVTQN
jgi:hypothetical protein